MEFSWVLVFASVLAIVSGLETPDAAVPVPDKTETAPALKPVRETPLPAAVPAPATTLEAVPKLLLTRDVSGPGLYRTEAGELVRVTSNIQEPMMRPMPMFRRSAPEPMPMPMPDPSMVRFMRRSPSSPNMPMPMMRSGASDASSPSARYYWDNLGYGYGAGYGAGYYGGAGSYAGYGGYPYASTYGSYNYPYSYGGAYTYPSVLY